MKNNLKLFLYAFFLKLFLNIVFLTCRWKTSNYTNFKKALTTKQPILLCFWHNQLICVSRYFKNSPLNLYGVSSTHFDSEILARILVSWKIKLIRGSSTRGWSSVLKQMITLFGDPSTIVALTNDGPQGPPKIAKEGSLSVAKKYNAQILCVSANINNKWKLNSWDQTLIPKPFSTITIHFSSSFKKHAEINSSNITDFINSNSFD